MTVMGAPLCAELAGAAAAIHAASELPEPWDEAQFRQLLALHGVAGRLIVIGAAPAGVILWRIVADEAEILTIAVAPSHRRGGIGRLLLRDALSALEDGRVVKVALEVAIDNTPARSLYRSLDFCEHGRRAGYYRTSAGPADALILVKQIDGRKA